MITLNQFRQMIPTNRTANEWFDISLDMFPKYDISSINRIAGFMAQCAHESNDFNNLEENLNYSWQRLRQVFPRYYKTDAEAQADHRNPERIANRVYNDNFRKYKLGNTEPGDGWRFHGRGIIQLTGRWNYEKFGKSIGVSAEEAAEYCSTKQGAFESACWYWNTNNLNRYCDRDDIVGLSKAVNGGDIGLSDRVSRYNNAKKLLNSNTDIQKASSQKTWQKGSKGPEVRDIQRALRLIADGDFGSNTEKAVMSWQRSNKYESNGIITEEQFKKLTNI